LVNVVKDTVAMCQETRADQTERP